MARRSTVDRAGARAGYDAFLAMCPSRQLLDRVANKWVTLVLCALGDASDRDRLSPAMRYSELSRLLAGVSQKMLTQTLRSLERDGLVTRTVVATVPVTVSYQITDLGLSLRNAVRGLKTWAELHMDDVAASRVGYDARSESTSAG